MTSDKSQGTDVHGDLKDVGRALELFDLGETKAPETFSCFLDKKTGGNQRLLKVLEVFVNTFFDFQLCAFFDGPGVWQCGCFVSCQQAEEGTVEEHPGSGRRLVWKWEGFVKSPLSF